MSFSVRSGHVFRKPCLVALSRLDAVGMKSASCKYWDGSGLEVCYRILFTKFSDCCVPRGTSHISLFLFLVNLIICFTFSCIDISCLYSVKVHPSSHKLLMILMVMY